MASTVNDITTTYEPRLTKGGSSARKSMLANAFELLLVFAFAITVSICHLHVHHSPNLCLLFDGTGYLATASGLMQAIKANPDLLGQIGSYIASGFAEPARLQLVEHLALANGITWSGPIVPTLLGASYSIVGKPAIAQFWAVGTWVMWVLEALTICLIWLSARISFNPATARIAALMACFYAPFTINSTRISAETPACFLITLAVTVLLFHVRRNFTRTKSMKSGVVYGAILGLMALSRSQLLFMPILFLAAIPLLARQLKLGQPFSKKWLAGIIIGTMLTLSPWALCNQIFTGKFSIAVDRSSAYNVYCGLSTRDLGYDTLPNECVSDPKKFKLNMSQALQKVASEAVEDPLRFATAMALKPIRLLDAPWNDFKVDFWSVPFTVQRLYHQAIILLSCLGLFCLLDEARKKRLEAGRLEAFAIPAVLSLSILYQFINCVAISMSRYFYPIMPVVLLLASYGCWRVCQSGASVRMRVATIASAVLLPLSIWMLDQAGSPSCMLLQSLALSCGIDCLSAIAAIGCLATLAVFFITAWKTLEWRSLISIAWGLLFVVCGAFCLFGTFFGVRQTEYLAELKRSSPLVASVPVATLPDQRDYDWFLVFDPLFDGQLKSYQQLDVKVNGAELDSHLILPLMAMDRSQRSSFEYQKSFAHSGGIDVSSLRQWFAIPVNDGVVRQSQLNEVEVSRKDDGKSFLACDFLNHDGTEIAPRDLRRFSWTLGFAANPPYDMRMLAYKKQPTTFAPGDSPSTQAKSPSIASKNVKPRIQLLAIARSNGAETSARMSTGDIDSIKLDGGAIPGPKGPLISQVIPAEQLPNTQQGIKQNHANSTLLTIAGQFRASDKAGSASVCLITMPRDSVTSSTHIAPMAPDSMAANNNWQRFNIVDIVPFEESSSGATGKRSFSCRVLMGGRSWWDILQYASFKVPAPVQFQNVVLNSSATRLPNMENDECHVFKCKPMHLPIGN